MKKYIITIINVLLIAIFMFMKRYTITINSTFIKWIALIFTLIWIMYDFYILCFKKATFSKVFKNLNGTLVFILIAVISIYTIQLLIRYYDGVIIKEYYPNDNIQSNEKLLEFDSKNALGLLA